MVGFIKIFALLYCGLTKLTHGNQGNIVQFGCMAMWLQMSSGEGCLLFCMINPA